MKKFSLAVLGYMLVTFPLGFVWHLILFKDQYEAFGVYSRPHPIIPLGILSMLIQGPILAHLYPRYRGTGCRMADAMKFCLLMGLFFMSGTSIALAAKSNIANLPAWFIYNFIFNFLQFGLVGLIFAFIFERDENVLRTNPNL